MTGSNPQPDDVVDSLVQAAKTERDAFGELFDVFYPAILAYCVRRLVMRDVAEDLTSEVFLKVAANIRQFSGITAEDFRRWLFRIATNEINAYLRQTNRRRELLKASVALGKIDASVSTPVFNGEEPVDWKDLYRELGQLSDREQSIISLRFFAGLKHDQIADVLNAQPNAVRTALSRALVRMRERLRIVNEEPLSQPSRDGGCRND